MYDNFNKIVSIQCDRLFGMTWMSFVTEQEVELAEIDTTECPFRYYVKTTEHTIKVRNKEDVLVFFKNVLSILKGE